MNRVQLSGTITEGPRFTQPKACLIGTFVLDAGQHDGVVHVIRVVALGLVAEQLKEYVDGETVKVSGSLRWQVDGAVEIFADEFKQHREGAYRQNVPTLNQGAYPRIHFRDK